MRWTSFRSSTFYRFPTRSCRNDPAALALSLEALPPCRSPSPPYLSGHRSRLDFFFFAFRSLTFHKFPTRSVLLSYYRNTHDSMHDKSDPDLGLSPQVPETSRVLETTSSMAVVMAMAVQEKNRSQHLSLFSLSARLSGHSVALR